MSASLVGSEMCIRDSTTSPPAKGAPTAQAPEWPIPHPLGPPQGSTATVSYTHLTLPTICSV
eukprot:11022136-Alexandrium_andersonii.AAC.1